MKEPAATSPFAAMTRQEQRHQWNVWHAQHNDAPTVELSKEQAQSVRSLPREERAQEEAAYQAKAQANPQTKPQESAPDTARDTQSQQSQQNSAHVMAMPKPHRGQYQAVLKRMEQAGRHTSAFASANPPSAAAMRTAAPVSATIPAAGAVTVSAPIPAAGAVPMSAPISAAGAVPVSAPISASYSAPVAPENSTVQPESGRE